MLESLLPRPSGNYLPNQLQFPATRWPRRYPGDVDLLRRMSLIAEDGVKRVRMAHLAVVGSHTVNGVSELHTRLLKESLLRDFDDTVPEKVSEQNQWHHPAALAAQSQSASPR